MKWHPILFKAEMVRAILDGSKTQTRRFAARWQVGDRLWVKETWAAFTHPDYFTGECDEIAGPPSDMPANYGAGIENVVYRADGDSAPSVWRPSIYMPRWASRITLLVTAVRRERLQDITDDDAIAEGARFTDYGKQCFHGPEVPCDKAVHPLRSGWSMRETTNHEQCHHSPRVAFASLWERIHGAGAWDRNDGVTVTDFQRVDG